MFSWNTLQTKVQNMGFEVTFTHRRNDAGGYMPDQTPPDGQGWVYVGNYDNVAGIWIKPLTDSSRKLSSSLARKMIAELDPFIETVADFEVEALDAYVSNLAPLQQLERSGRRRVLVSERRRAPNSERRGAPKIDQLAPGMVDRREQQVIH